MADYEITYKIVITGSIDVFDAENSEHAETIARDRYRHSIADFLKDSVDYDPSMKITEVTIGGEE